MIFKHIFAHEGPLLRAHLDYKCSKYNVQTEWKNGEIIFKLLDSIAMDDPIICAVYGRGNKLPNLPEWKQYRTIVMREKNMLQMVNQDKLRSYNYATQ